MQPNPDDPYYRRLINPLSAEFGVYDRGHLDLLLEKALPAAKLVSLFFCHVVLFALVLQVGVWLLVKDRAELTIRACVTSSRHIF